MAVNVIAGLKASALADFISQYTNTVNIIRKRGKILLYCWVTRSPILSH